MCYLGQPLNQSTRIIAPGTDPTTLPKLKTVNLTRFASSDSFTPPTWMGENDFFSDDAVLNLVNYTSGSNAISFSSNKLTGLGSKIKTVILPGNVSGIPINQYITGIGLSGNVTSIPRWFSANEMSGAWMNVSTLDLSLLTATSFNLNGLPSNFAKLFLSPSITSISNMPNTITHLSSYYSTYLRYLDLNSTSITHLTLNNVGDITVKNNFLCNLTKLQSFSAPFATIHIDVGDDSSVELKFLCNSSSLKDINILNLDIAGVKGKNISTGQFIPFNFDSKSVSFIPGTSADDKFFIDALDLVADGNGKYLSQAMAPILLLKALWDLKSNAVGPAMALQPLLLLLKKVAPKFAEGAAYVLSHFNAIQTAATGFSTLVSIGTFSQIVFEYGPDSLFDSKKGRLRAYVRINIGTAGQSISCFNNLTKLRNITLDSIKLAGGEGGSAATNFDTPDVGAAGIGGAISFLQGNDLIESVSIKSPLNISAGKGGHGRDYSILNLENSLSYEVVLLINPFLAPYLVPMILLNRLFDVDLPPIGYVLAPLALFSWSAPIVLDINQAASGAINLLSNEPQSKLTTLTLSTTESDENFNTLFNAGTISTLNLIGNATVVNSQKSLPKYLNGNNTATVGSTTLDLTKVDGLPTILNLRTLNPKFSTIKLPTGVKYLARSNQTLQGGTPFSTSDYSIFLDNQDGEGLVDLRFLDGVVSSGYTLYAPLSLSCYLGPVDFTMPIPNDITTNSQFIYNHSNGSQYTRTIKRKTIVNDTLDLSDVGLTSSKTMRIDSLTGVKKVLLPEQIETVILPSSAEELTGHIRLKNVSGTNKLKKIKLTGDINYGEPPATIELNGNITISLSGGAWPPAYVMDARLTATDATLDLSGVQNLPYELDLTILNSNISRVILNPKILQGTRLSQDDNDTYSAKLDKNGQIIQFGSSTPLESVALSYRATKIRTVLKNVGGEVISTGPLLTTTLIKAYTTLSQVEGVTNLKRIELIGSANNNANFLPNWVLDKYKTSSKGLVLDLSKVIDLPSLFFIDKNNSNITDLILSENTTSIIIHTQTFKTLTAYTTIQFLQNNGINQIGGFIPPSYGTASIRYLRLLGDNTTLPAWLSKNPPHTDYLNEVFASGQSAEELRTKLDLSNMSKLPTTLDLRNIISMFNVALLPLHILDVTLSERIIEISSLSDYVETLTASVAAISNLALYAVEDSTPHTESNRLNQRVHLSKIIITEGDLTTAIGDNFLRKVEGTFQIDFSNIVENITSVGANFLTDSSDVKICFSVNKTPSAALCTALNTLSGRTLKLTGATSTLPAWLTQNAKVPSSCTLDLTELSGLDPIVNLKGLASDITKFKFTDAGYYCDVSTTLSNEEALDYILTNTETIINQAPAQHKTTTRASISKISDLETKIAAGTVSGSTRRVNLVPPVQTLQSAHYINTSGQTVEGGIQTSIPTQAVSNGVLDLSAESSLNTHLDLTTKDATTVKLPSNTVAVILHENVTTLEFGDNLMHLSWNTTNTNVKNIRLINGTATTIPFIRNPAGVNLNISSMTNLGSTIDIKNLKGTLSADVRKISLPSNTTTIKLTGSASNLSDALSFVDDSAYGHLMLDLSSATGLQGTDFLLSLPKIAKEITLPSSVSNITLPVNFTELTAPSSLAGVTLAQGHPKLSKVNLTGSVTTLPNWVTNNSVTQTDFILDVSQITYPNNSLLDISGTVAGTVVVPLGVSRIKASSSLQTIQLVGSHPGLTKIAITGASTTIPTWATDASLTAAIATLDLSEMTGLTIATITNTDIKMLYLPNTVTNLTIPSTVATLSGTSSSTILNLTGASTTVPAWVTDGSLTAAALDLSAMTGLTSTINLVGINSDIKMLYLPNTVTNLTIPSTVTTVSGKNTLTTLKLTGASTTIPTWATDGSLTAATATLDLSAMTGLTSTVNLVGINSDITTVILPSGISEMTAPDTLRTVQLSSGAQKMLTKIAIIGASTTIPTWAKNGSLTAPNDAILDLSEMTGLTSTINLVDIHSDITTIILPIRVTNLTIPSTVTTVYGTTSLTTLKLTGASTTIPEWATDGSLWATDASSTAPNDATLDLSEMTGLTSTINLVGINSDITTVILPNTVTNLTIPSTVTTVSGTNTLTTLKLTGASTTVPGWATDGSLTAATATLDLSAMTGLTSTVNLVGINSDIAEIILPNTLKNLTVPATITSLTGGGSINTLKLTGDAQTLPAYEPIISNNATLDISELASGDVDINSPYKLSGIIISSTSPMISTTSSINNLNIIKLIGSFSSIPAYLQTENLMPPMSNMATLDLSDAEWLASEVNVDFLNLNSRFTSVLLPDSITKISINAGLYPVLKNTHPKLSEIIINNIISPSLSPTVWIAINGSKTADDALVTLNISSPFESLDLSELTNTIQLYLHGALIDNLTLPLSANIKSLPDVKRLTLKGNAATLPAWVNQCLNGYMFQSVLTSSILDLSELSDFRTIDFTTITNSQIRTLILGNQVHASNTTGWTNSYGTVWTR